MPASGPADHRAAPLSFAQERDVNRAVSALRAGELVAFPTDTVYAVACTWDNTDALARVFATKQRAPDKTLPILVSSVTAAERFGDLDHPLLAELLSSFWPGALTVVVPSRRDLPAAVRGTDPAGRATVALRMPNHPLAHALIERAGGAVAATSANLSGASPALTGGEALATLGCGIGVALDNDFGLIGTASTVIRVTGPTPQVLREGAIPAATIARFIDGRVGQRRPSASR